MKRVLLAAAGVLIAAGPAQAADRDVVYQVSTVGALQAGLYQPAESVDDLLQHGDFGLGTFEGLDGEMIVTSGTVFQVPFSGVGRVARPSWETPFAVVTHFDADQRFRLRRTLDLTALGSAIDRRIASTNYFYAVKVTGRFRHLQTRSVARQSKPYAPLAAAVEGQRTFDLANVRGTLVGIRSPDFVGSMNVPGYHWHFISDDGKRGGHVLQMSAAQLRVTVDESRRWHVELPRTKAFRNSGLG